MKWTDKNSIMLTRISIYLFLIVGVVAIVFADTIAHDIIFPGGFITDMGFGDITTFVICMQLGIVVAIVILALLHKLVMNLSKDEVFTEENIHLLRMLSWLCMLECVLDVGFAFNYASWILVAAAMGFIALIIRVIKNVFCQAYLLKEENDFTI